MNLIEVNYREDFLNHDEKFSAENSAEHSLSPDSLSTDGISGEPSVTPRIGDQYQVEIPSLLSGTERLQLRNTPAGNDDRIDVKLYTGKELAIPVIWVHHEADHVRHVQDDLLGSAIGSDTVRSPLTTDGRIDSKCSTFSGLSPDNFNNCHSVPQDAVCKVEISADPLDHGKQFNLRNNISTPSLQSRKKRGYIPLPGSPKAPWSDSEAQSFLLGLYIYGKNLVQVQRFVESKDMGDVLSFYYGKFYRSDAQRRWVECRKIRSRRCIIGHRIFTGWRQQELLSRLLSSKPKEVQDTLLEVMKAFNEGTATLEEFIFSLKAIVGTEALVEAVGIGKGKQDLTGVVLDPVRTNPVVSTRPEIPVGKACSSLTSGEIVKFLTGDFRLSKAKSNDLFWEAVWPRLLARGWHSEQPKDVSYLGSKNALVFLIPGIRKFSRKKLTKGNHYFDSVSDVLNKVASDPRLIELESEEGKESGRANDESRWNTETADTKVVQNGPSDRHRPCYLRPRLPDCNSDLMKFTVVDTSLAEGGGPSKVRELRSLPTDANRSFRRNHQGGVTNSDSSTEQSSSGDTSLNNPGEHDQSLSDEKKVRNNRKSASIKAVQSSLSDHVDTDPQLSMLGNGYDLEGHCYELFIDKPAINDTKYQSSRRVKSGEQSSLASAPKRQRLTSCKYVGTGPSFSGSTSIPRDEPTSIPRDERLKIGEQCLHLESAGTNKASSSEDRTTQEGSNEAVLSQEKSQPRTLIDLNLHPEDFDHEGPLEMEVEGSQDDLKPKHEPDDSQASEMNIVLPDEQQPMNGRRHSTRNRPPTAKALEALACGFLSARKERSMKTSRSGNLASRSSRRARKNVAASLSAPATNLASPNPNPMFSSVGMDEEYSQTSNHASLFDNSHIRTERKETHELLGVL